MKTKCHICGDDAGRRETNARKILVCQRCFVPLCDDCTVYGYDGLPRCEGCHFKHSEDCGECGEKGKCETCEWVL